MNRDPQFGPLLMFGLGGVYVEALKDVTFRVAPIDRREAKEMLSEIRAYNCCAACAAKSPRTSMPSQTRWCAFHSLSQISRISWNWTSTRCWSFRRDKACWASICAWR